MSKQLLFISLFLYTHTNIQPNQNPLFLDTNALRIINGVGVIAAAANAWGAYNKTSKEHRAAVATIMFGLLAAPHIATIIWPEPQSSIRNHSTNTHTENNHRSFIHIGDLVENGSITNNNVTTYYVGSSILLALYSLNLYYSYDNKEKKYFKPMNANYTPILILSMNLLHYFLKSIQHITQK